MGYARRGLLAGAVLASVFIVYVATLYPSVPGGDAGELIAVADQLEVAHPPGYPLYTLLAKLFTFVPLGSVAWRVNLFSAFCDAAAAAFLCAIVFTASGSAAAAVAASLLFALSPLVWTYAVGAEVFPLNNLFAAALFFLALEWHRTRDLRYAYAIAAVLGLGLANHHTLVFYGGPLAIWLLWDGRAELLRPRRLATLLAAGAAGLMTYAYLWVAGRDATLLSWGDTSTWQGFVDHILRRDYGTFRLASDSAHAPPSLVSGLRAYGAHALGATLGVGALLALVGVADALGVGRRRAAQSLRSWAALLLVCYGLYLWVFHTLANLSLDNPLLAGVLARFWQQADVVVFIFLGLGIAALEARLPARQRAAGWVAAAALVATRLGLSFTSQDQSDNDVIARYGRALLEPLPADALLLTRGDLITNTTRYLQGCEDLRRDVIVLDQELMTKAWYVARARQLYPRVSFPGRFYDPREPEGFSMRRFLEANAGTSVFIYPEWKAGDASIEGVYDTWPMGLASRVAPRSAGLAPDQWMRDSAQAMLALDRFAWPGLDRFEAGTWEQAVVEDVWQAEHRRGLWLLTKAIEKGGDPALLAAARASLEAAERTRPDPPWYIYRNLGIVYELLGARIEQLHAWRRYLQLAPADDGARMAVAAAVSRLETELGAIPGSPPAELD